MALTACPKSVASTRIHDDSIQSCLYLTTFKIPSLQFIQKMFFTAASIS